MGERRIRGKLAGTVELVFRASVQEAANECENAMILFLLDLGEG